MMMGWVQAPGLTGTTQPEVHLRSSLKEGLAAASSSSMRSPLSPGATVGMRRVAEAGLMGGMRTNSRRRRQRRAGGAAHASPRARGTHR